MDNFLARMKAGSLARVSQVQQPGPLAALQAECFNRPRPIPLDRSRPGIIAEIKPISPAQGQLTPHTLSIADCIQRAKLYEANGAVALSILTEPTAFGGSMDYLKAAAQAVNIPVMRKDFLVHPIQVDEAAASGASGVLLIARLVTQEILLTLIQRARERQLFVLLEAFDAQDLAQIRQLPIESSDLLIGVNTRDLTTLNLRPNALRTLPPHLPNGCAAVAESGLHSAGDILAAKDNGYGFHLVGTALMTSPRPDLLLRDMTQAAQTQEAA